MPSPRKSTTSKNGGGKDSKIRPTACTKCHKAKTKCDMEKPCNRCVRLGMASKCVPYVRQQGKESRAKPKGRDMDEEGRKMTSQERRNLEKVTKNSLDNIQSLSPVKIREARRYERDKQKEEAEKLKKAQREEARRRAKEELEQTIRRSLEEGEAAARAAPDPARVSTSSSSDARQRGHSDSINSSESLVFRVRSCLPM